MCAQAKQRNVVQPDCAHLLPPNPAAQAAVRQLRNSCSGRRRHARDRGCRLQPDAYAPQGLLSRHCSLCALSTSRHDAIAQVQSSPRGREAEAYLRFIVDSYARLQPQSFYVFLQATPHADPHHDTRIALAYAKLLYLCIPARTVAHRWAMWALGWTADIP